MAAPASSTSSSSPSESTSAADSSKSQLPGNKLSRWCIKFTLSLFFFYAEKVRKCIRALEAAETDTEKFATLFLVPKLVHGTECDKNARLSLMKVRIPRPDSSSLNVSDLRFFRALDIPFWPECSEVKTVRMAVPSWCFSQWHCLCSAASLRMKKLWPTLPYEMANIYLCNSLG